MKSLSNRRCKENPRLIYHRAEVGMRIGAKRGCQILELGVTGSSPGLERVTFGSPYAHEVIHSGHGGARPMVSHRSISESLGYFGSFKCRVRPG